MTHKYMRINSYQNVGKVSTIHNFLTLIHNTKYTHKLYLGNSLSLINFNVLLLSANWLMRLALTFF